MTVEEIIAHCRERWRHFEEQKIRTNWPRAKQVCQSKADVYMELMDMLKQLKE